MPLSKLVPAGRGLGQKAGTQLLEALLRHCCQRTTGIHGLLQPTTIWLADDSTVQTTWAGVVHQPTDDARAVPLWVGDPDYLAPELLTGAPRTPALDVYAFACVAQFVFTGRAPTPVSERPAEVPTDWWGVLVQARSADPAARWLNLFELGCALFPQQRLRPPPPPPGVPNANRIAGVRLLQQWAWPEMALDPTELHVRQAGWLRFHAQRTSDAQRVRVHQFQGPLRNLPLARCADAWASLQKDPLVKLWPLTEVGGVEDGLYVLEAIPTQTLADRGAVANVVAAQYLTQITKSVRGLHQKNLLHGSLQPDTLALNADGSVSLLQWGWLNQPSGSGLTGKTRNLGGCHWLGEPRYLAPELLAHGEVSPASDVFSLGAVLYFLLTQQPPFAADTLPDLLTAMQTPPLAPHELRSTVAPALSAIALRCLRHRPSERYTTLALLLLHLTAFLQQAG
jgi:serine/threonine protein kinase